MNKYRVQLSSKPGMWEYYDGHVDVWADNDSEAETLAVKKLAMGAFKDRGYNAWNVKSVTRERAL